MVSNCSRVQVWRLRRCLRWKIGAWSVLSRSVDVRWGCISKCYIWKNISSIKGCSVLRLINSSMSSYRHNAEDTDAHLYGSRLSAKETQIHKLQSELVDLTQAKLDYTHSTQALEKLKKKFTDAENEKERADFASNENSRSLNQLLKSVKQEFEMMSVSFKAKGGELDDILEEKRNLGQSVQQKDAEIGALKSREDVNHQLQFLITEQENLLQHEQLMKTQVKQLEEDIYETTKNHKIISKSLASKEAAILSLKLQLQNKDRKLDLYEQENNALDGEVDEAIQRESQLLKEICANENQQKDLALEEISLKTNLRRLEKTLEELSKTIKLYDRQRNRDAKAAVKTKQSQLRRLHQAQLSEHNEINLLTKKNAQISEINMRLRSDVTFCEDHFNNVKKCNELMVEFLERCKQEDKNIIQLIQKRMESATMATQKSGVVAGQKMNCSRSTQNSSWLNA